MSGELHEISQAIGRLEAHAESAQRDSENIWQVINQIRDGQQAVLRKLDAVGKQDERITKLEATATETSAWKNRALGAMAVLSAIAGLIGAFIPPLIKSAWAKWAG